MGNFPTLADYRQPIMDQLAGFSKGTIDIDPELLDPDAARSLISAKLFDGEKLADAYGGQYVWVPRYSDSRRIEERGYRVRYRTVFEPPTQGTYKLRMYGIGETNQLSWSSSAGSVQAAIRAFEDVNDAEVTKGSIPGTLVIALTSRVGFGSTAGRILAQGGVGVCLVNRDFSQPLTAGLTWLKSALIPFEAEDEAGGLHGCINLALNHFLVPDLFPVTATLPANVRPRVLNLSSVGGWIEPDLIIGYYAPTDWQMDAEFVPPVSGTYTMTLTGWKDLGPTASLLPYNATGAQIEAELRALPGVGSNLSVTPQSAASSYLISWTTMYYDSGVRPSAGYIRTQTSYRLREPFPTSIAPGYRSDFETPSLTDPGYPEGQSWFIHVKRKGGSKTCPQTYPRKTDGTLDLTASPILGTTWMESTAGLINDLDQGFPPVEKVAEVALKYVYSAIAAASPRGEAAEWLDAARRQAGSAAAPNLYGPIKRRGSSIPARGNVGVGINAKGLDYWLPD